MTRIRDAHPGDIKEIVNVHLASFPNFFLSFLGRRFLQILYREIMREPGNVSLVATAKDERVVGLAFGIADQSALYSRLAAKKWIAFALASARAVVKQPMIVPRLWRALRYARGVTGSTCSALLMSLAVSPSEKGKGMGKLLVHEFARKLKEEGVEEFCLTTDRDDNDSTNAFYSKLGFTRARVFATREGRWMNEYVIKLDRLKMDSRGTNDKFVEASKENSRIPSTRR